MSRTDGPGFDDASVAAAAERVRSRIASAGGDPDATVLLAVTKGFGPAAVEAACAAGLSAVGENYAQELLAKSDALGAAAPGPTWHFIGRLQSNKIRSLAPVVAVWQSIDRRSLVDELARRAPGARIMVQVGVPGLGGKGGCPPDEVGALVGHARASGLDVVGLMAVGVAGDDAASRSCFSTTSVLADTLDLHHRSMGMSGDLEAAVVAGSTMIRVGTALFGPRPPRD